MVYGAARAAWGVGICAWLLGGCLGALKVEGGTGGGDGGAGGQAGSGGQGGAAGQGGDEPACGVELCHTPETESCDMYVCPSVGWSVRVGDASDQDARAIAAKSSSGADRIYVAGRFRGALAVGDTQIVSEGESDDAFVAAIDGDGKGAWVRSVGGSDQGGVGLGDVPRLAFGVAVDTTDQVVVGGAYRTTTPGSGLDDHDGFVRAWPSGATTAAWTRTFGGAGYDRAVAVTTAANAVFVLGTIGAAEGTSTPVPISCNGETIHPVPAGETHMLLVRYSAQGACQWALVLEGGVHEPTALAATLGGDVFVAGAYGGALLGAGPDVPATGGKAGFVMKVGSAGFVTWLRTFGGGPAGDMAHPRALALTPGSVRVTGSLGGSIDFGAGPIEASKESPFVLALDEGVGNTLWSTRIGGEESPAAFARGVGITTLLDGSTLVAGTFFPSFDVDPNVSGDEIEGYAQSAFLARFDELGVLQTFDAWGDGESPAERPISLTSANEAVYVATGWSNRLGFEAPNVTPAGQDLVVARFNP